MLDKSPTAAGLSLLDNVKALSSKPPTAHVCTAWSGAELGGASGYSIDVLQRTMSWAKQVTERMAATFNFGRRHHGSAECRNHIPLPGHQTFQREVYTVLTPSPHGISCMSVLQSRRAPTTVKKKGAPVEDCQPASETESMAGSAHLVQVKVKKKADEKRVAQRKVAITHQMLVQ